MNAARWRLGLLATSLTALLVACGGGGGQVEPFAPTRLLSFGDESSLVLPDGRRYSVSDFKRNASDNTVVQPPTVDCAANPIWTQTMATNFGFVMAACNPDAKPVTAFQYATVGAKVADIKTQIDQHLASGTVGPKDLIAVMVGTNDILELYQQYPAQNEAQITAQITSRGRALAAQVNRLANANGRIVVSTVPDVGTTPYGLAQKAAHTDTDRSALLSRLSQTYNSAMRLDLINDGRLIGLVLLDETLNQAIRFPGIQGLVNVNTAACATALPNCTTATLVTDASATTWLWSDSTRLSPRGQSILSQLALTRAVSNPF
jgi:outer membrane lipase/esterase